MNLPSPCGGYQQIKLMQPATDLDPFEVADLDPQVSACQQIPFDELDGWAGFATFIPEAATR